MLYVLYRLFVYAYIFLTMIKLIMWLFLRYYFVYVSWDPVTGFFYWTRSSHLLLAYGFFHHLHHQISCKFDFNLHTTFPPASPPDDTTTVWSRSPTWIACAFFIELSNFDATTPPSSSWSLRTDPSGTYKYQSRKLRIKPSVRRRIVRSPFLRVSSYLKLNTITGSWEVMCDS